MPGYAVVTGPTLDPVSLAEAKAHCRIDSSDDDALLAGYILAARQYVERATGRVLMTQRWNYFLDHAWPKAWDGSCYRSRIVIPLPPLRSIISMQYVDSNGATQTLAADQYWVATSALYGIVEPAYGVTWPAVRSQVNTITILFEAGYGTNPGDIPEPIRQAMLLLVGHWYEHRETVVVGVTPSELPFAVEALLFPFRVFY